MITLINPNLVVQLDDLFTTGIVYMPLNLAYFAGVIRQNGFQCSVIDAFGERTCQVWKDNGFMFRGLTPLEVANKIDANSKVIVIYAGNVTYHSSVIQLVKAISFRYRHIPLIVMENTEAVTSYSLRRVQDAFYDVGVDYIVTGEAEERGMELLKAVINGDARKSISAADGIGYRNNGVTHYIPPEKQIVDLDTLPFPAWDLFPLQNYWKLRYAHGPFNTKRYLPIQTSRGCKYRCNFCIMPEMSNRKWRARSAVNVVDEMEEYSVKFGVREFHIEDPNPTVNDKRICNICEEIIGRKLNITWKIAAGTKVETIRDETTIDLMAKAGCRYISISPETGSPRILRKINKPFNLEHAIRMVKEMNKVGIFSQACFVLGYPGENDEDRQMTRKLVHDLTKVGVDEIALFIITPVPGSAIFDGFYGYGGYSQLNFSPTWRQDYTRLNRFRFGLYRNFLFWKLRYHPWKIAKQPVNFLTRRFETKMEMAPYRALHTAMLKLGLGARRIKNEN